MKTRLKLVLLSGILTLPLITTACPEHRRVYDPYRQDYHRWDRDEDVYYRQWLGERHYEYRKFNRWDSDHQNDYWKWRHDHH